MKSNSIAQSREDKMKVIMARIKADYKKLKKLGYTLSDCASTITLFDDKMFDKSFYDLSNKEQEQAKVDYLS